MVLKKVPELAVVPARNRLCIRFKSLALLSVLLVETLTDELIDSSQVAQKFFGDPEVQTALKGIRSSEFHVIIDETVYFC